MFSAVGQIPTSLRTSPEQNFVTSFVTGVLLQVWIGLAQERTKEVPVGAKFSSPV